MLPQAREALLAALDEGWADPGRLHTEGRRARLLVDGAREAVAAALGARAEEVAFTGSHTTALHAGVLGTLLGRVRVGDVLVHSAVEHSAVLAAAQWHRERGGTCTEVAVDQVGRVDVQAFATAVGARSCAVAALQAANGEVGTVQPVDEVLAACRRARVPLLVDAAAAAGQIELPGYDLLAADPQAWGSPGGVGVLVVRAGVRWRSPWPEDPAVPADRPGTPGSAGVPQVLAAAVGLRTALAGREAAHAARRRVVQRLRDRIPAVLGDVVVVGDPDLRLPHVLTFSCLFADGEALTGELDAAGFAVGSGSACSASTLVPSHVLAAMGALTQGNVRIALPATGTQAELEAQVDRFLEVLPQALGRVRDRLGTSQL